MEAVPLLNEALVWPRESLLSAAPALASRVMLAAPVTLVALATVTLVEDEPSVRVMPLPLSWMAVPAKADVLR